jgi:2-polyprenyl-6-methoxyphenol hydroxylase-like FAD-dependent oxidoreductase
MKESTDHAVVLGASLAGLLAARVLSEVYAQVTVVDRDALPDGPAHRRGVPQARHAHGLLARGREAMEELQPGLTAELVDRGALTGDIQRDFGWINEGRRLCPAESGLLGLIVSRALLEDAVRGRVRALPNVRLVEGCDGAGLTATRDGSRVTGLRILSRADGSAEQSLAADLVVDASGRGSRSAVWLAALGCPEPELETVRIGLAYASRTYRRVPEHLGGGNGVAIAAATSNSRGGVLIAQEDDRWILSCGGMLGDEAPLDHRGFTDFTATLPAPAINEVVRDAEPLSDPVRYRFPANVRRRYERMRRFPAGYLVTGDALCSFNPVYGQGMSVAAAEALALRDCLRRGSDRLGTRFLAAAARIVDVPWQLTVGADLRFPDVEGPRTATVRAVNAYLPRLHAAAEHDPAVGRAFLRVINLLDRPERLMAPDIAMRVLRSGRRARATARSLPVEPVSGAR